MDNSSSKAELVDTLSKINGLHALVIGDVILDRYIWGDADRISPEAPVPIVKEDRRESRLGGAANVVRNLRAVGVDVSLCGFVGDDKEGSEVFDLLKSENVATDGLFVDRSRPTALKTRVIASRQQMLRIDREYTGQHSAALCEGFAAMVEASIEKADLVILSDYAKGAVSETLISKLEALQKKEILSLKGKPFFVDPHPSNYKMYKTICVAKPNRKEAEAAVGYKISSREEAIVAANDLMKLWNSEMIAITLGADGMVIVDKVHEEPIFLDTVARDVFDVSGAGDTVTALFAASLAAGASIEISGRLANIAAGIVVSEVGTAPVSFQKLSAELTAL